MGRMRRRMSRVLTTSGQLPIGVVANVTSGVAPLLVSFNATVPSGAGPFTYQWSFGDGSPNSTAPSPSHNFTSPGNFVVALNVTNGSGAWGSSYLTVRALHGLTVHANALPAGNGTAVEFGTTVAGGLAPYQVRWVFGDGATSDTSAPIHRFSSPGTFTVHVTVTDRLGVTGDLTLTIGLTAPSDPAFSPRSVEATPLAPAGNPAPGPSLALGPVPVPASTANAPAVARWTGVTGRRSAPGGRGAESEPPADAARM